MTLADLIAEYLYRNEKATVSEIATDLGIRRQTIADAVEALGYPIMAETAHGRSLCPSQPVPTRRVALVVRTP